LMMSFAPILRALRRPIYTLCDKENGTRMGVIWLALYTHDFFHSSVYLS
jgi:hypothetical protein